MKKQLYKNKNGAMWLGVINGISEYIGIDVSILRILVVVLAFSTAVFPAVIIYIVAAYILPEKSSLGFRDYTID